MKNEDNDLLKKLQDSYSSDDRQDSDIKKQSDKKTREDNASNKSFTDRIAKFFDEYFAKNNEKDTDDDEEETVTDEFGKENSDNNESEFPKEPENDTDGSDRGEFDGFMQGPMDPEDGDNDYNDDDESPFENETDDYIYDDYQLKIFDEIAGIALENDENSEETADEASNEADTELAKSDSDEETDKSSSVVKLDSDNEEARGDFVNSPDNTEFSDTASASLDSGKEIVDDSAETVNVNDADKENGDDSFVADEADEAPGTEKRDETADSTALDNAGATDLQKIVAASDNTEYEKADENNNNDSASDANVKTYEAKEADADADIKISGVEDPDKDKDKEKTEKLSEEQVEENTADENADKDKKYISLEKIISAEIADIEEHGKFDSVNTPDELQNSAAFESMRKMKQYIRKYRMTYDESLNDGDYSPCYPDNAEESNGDVFDDDILRAKANEFSNEDISFMIRLGYEEELSNREGSDKVDSLKETLISEKLRNNTEVSKHFKGEYDSPLEKERINRQFKKDRLVFLLKYIGVILMAALLFVYDNIEMLGLNKFGDFVLTDHKIGYCLGGLAALLIASLPIINCLREGVKDLLALDPGVSTITVLSIVVCGAYDIFCALSDAAGDISMFNFCASICIIASLLNDMFALRRNTDTFSVVSSGKENKYVCDKIKDGSAPLVHGRRAFSPENSGMVYPEYRVRSVNFVDGFVRRTEAKAKNMKGTGYFIVFSLSVSIIISALSFALHSDIGLSLRAFVGMFMLSTPFQFIIFRMFPFAVGARKLRSRGCAIVGDVSLDEYNKKKTLIFDGVDMMKFANGENKKTRLYPCVFDDDMMQTYIVYFKRLFDFIGDKIQDLDIGNYDDMPEPDFEIVSVADTGMEAYVNSNINIIVGSKEYMISRGIRLRHGNPVEEVSTYDGCCTLYVAFDRVLKFKCELNYDIKKIFEEMIKVLVPINNDIAIRTYNPCFNNSLIKKLCRKKESMSVAVKKPDKMITEPKSANSGVVASKSAQDIKYPLMFAHIIERVKKCGVWLGIIEAVIGAAIAAVFTVAGAEMYMYAIIAALYKMLWFIPAFILPVKKMAFPKEKRKSRDALSNKR